jgi:pyruvate dehydrogenase E1 component alpha subunit
MRVEPFTDIELKEIWRLLAKTRLVEAAVISEYPNQEIRCPVHLSVGQEAVAVGICTQLDSNDVIISTHRSHAHFIASGGDIGEFFKEIYGLPNEMCSGRGGSMHLFSVESGLRASIPIVGSGLAIAAGFAYSKKAKNDSGIAVAFVGDAVLETGVFHEVCNFAMIKSLPLLIVCENNSYSTYSHISHRQTWDDLAAGVSSMYKMKSKGAQGDDVLKIVELTHSGLRHVRSGEGPFFLEFTVTRELEHCGYSNDDHLGYRVSPNGEGWSPSDPIANARLGFHKMGISDFDLASIWANEEEEVSNKLKYVKGLLQTVS